MIFVILQFHTYITPKVRNWNHYEMHWFTIFETKDIMLIVVLQLHHPEAQLESFVLSIVNETCAMLKLNLHKIN